MLNKIQMVDLYAQYLTIKEDIDNAIQSVIKDGAYVGGKYVEKFEQEIADYCGTKYAVALNSGTDALYLPLWAYDIKEGDEVITTPFTFFATGEVIQRVGATPIFVDINPNTFNIDENLIEAKITNKTKAIIPVHLYGYPANIEKIMDIAKKYGLKVIEDACQAIGSLNGGKKVGSIGDVGAFSFYPSKNLGAYGDGGILTTNDKALADKVKNLRNHGSIIKYHNDEIGVSSRLDGIQASILSTKLKYLDKWNIERNRVANNYDVLLSQIDWIELPEYEIDEENTHVYHQYSIKVKNGKRDQLQEYLKENGIGSMVYYPIPLHMLGAMKDFGYKKGDFPMSEQVADEVISLPIYPELSDEMIEKVVEVIKSMDNYI